MTGGTRHRLLILLGGTLLGALAGLGGGALLGMLIAGDSQGMAGKEAGFVGFLRGLFWGPPVGALLGALLAWATVRKGRNG